MHQSAAILAGWPWGHMQASLGIWWVFRGRSRIFLGRGALASCSTSTPINQIVLFFFAEYQLYLKTAGHLRGGSHPLHPPPRSVPGFVGNFFSRMLAALFKRIPGERPKGFLSLTEPPTIWNWTSASLQRPGTPPSRPTHLWRGTD